MKGESHNLDKQRDNNRMYKKKNIEDTDLLPPPIGVLVYLMQRHCTVLNFQRLVYMDSIKGTQDKNELDR